VVFRSLLLGLIIFMAASVTRAQDVSPLGEDVSSLGEPVPAVLFDPSIGLNVPPVKGAPGGRSTRLAELVTQQAAERGVHIASSSSPDTEPFELSGIAAAGTGTEVSTILVLWSLYRADGSPVDSFNAELTLKDVIENPWDEVDEALLLELARITADRLVRMEDQFAMAPLPRPKPLELAAVSGNDVTSAGKTKQNGEVLDTLAARANRPTPIRIGTVTGAPGDGNSVLLEHVRALLGERDIPIATGKDTKWYQIGASVTLTDAGINKETVVIVWTVTDPLGEELGQVRQQNDLPPGALEPQWGDDAKFAAQGAVDGILSLLSQSGEVY